MCKISVITAVYNAERFIGETLQSILNQTYADFEVLVMDDASEDNSEKIIRQYMKNDSRIRYYKNERNAGIAKTKNKGLDLAAGQYICILDHDDIALPDKLRVSAEYLDAHEDIQVVGGNFIYINEKGERINKVPSAMLFNPEYIRAYLMFNNALANGAAMFRKEFVDRNHIRYREDMYGIEDYFFWVECSLNGYITNINEDMFKLRTNPNRVTEQIRENQWQKRKEAFDQLHQFALEGWGFSLTKEDYFIINKAFMEDGGVDSREEIGNLFQALQKICRQAEELNLAHKKEIATMCRKRFGDKIGKAFFLWENK